jgi:NAD(P)-dependent dehydrogenase (short-subunit alcohol dehydrogenase family)
VLCRTNEAKLSRARDRVRDSGTGAPVDTLVCDFRSLRDVAALADPVLAAYDRLDVLINNAGTMFAERDVTDDGYEATFAVNHLFALVKRVTMLTPAKGACAVTRLATDPGLTAVTGQYFHRNRVKRPAPLAQDMAVARRLNQECDRLLSAPRKDREP